MIGTGLSKSLKELKDIQTYVPNFANPLANIIIPGIQREEYFR